MASNRRRNTRDAPPRSDDESDEDFDMRASNPSSNKRKAKTQGRSTGAGLKRQRRGEYESDDIEDESDEELSSEESEEEPFDVLNEKTGRPVRRSVNKAAHYEELSNSEQNEDSGEDINARKKKARSEARRPMPSLVVKLKLPPTAAPTGTRGTRARTTSKGIVAPPEQLGTRRSSRHKSHEDSAPMMPLQTSGRATRTTRSSVSQSPAPYERRTRGSKGVRKPSTSDILEVSQEDSGQGGLVLLESDVLGVDENLNCLPATMDASTIVTDVGVAEVVRATDDEDDEDDMPVKRTRQSTVLKPQIAPPAGRSPRRARGRDGDESSEYNAAGEEAEEEEELSPSEGSASPQKATQQSDISSTGRRSRRVAAKNAKASQRSRVASVGSEDLDPDELAEEAADLRASRNRKRRVSAIVYEEPNLRRRGKKVDYRIFKPETVAQFAEDDEPPEIQSAAARRKRAGGAWRALYSTYGPFGGGGLAPVFAGAEGAGVIGGVDSDTSDEDAGTHVPRPLGVSTVGMTPTSALPMSLFAQTLNADPSIGMPGMGKNKEKKALADADPLGVDEKVTFTGVGGLDGHINQLKEMVILPLLYPEVFQRFKVTPPRGVLFHGPPGTGKTLLARALASSVSAGGQKIQFYMRKGADTLSKYVGEAERQLRVLFEEAKKTQPSIIFFDEIDGLAPVRSSKQDQVHASIVATLLALMDGMDGRGQVIVIGATNRPDSVDSALRRPGRFDREFYFPLPDQAARRSIIDIHTTGWEPALLPAVKNELAALSKGYGGADLRALCTEAALNAVQGTYPQIYTSNEKLEIDPTQIRVLAKDFMISLNRMIPSSERSGSTGSAPLESRVEPLLRHSLSGISKILDEILPPKKTTTALEEAQFDDRDEDAGFDKEMMRQAFERARVYRPRLLIHGPPGMGQQYLGGAILNKFERLFVQSVGLSVLYGESSRTPEAAIVQLFNEAKRHKPSVIYIPNITTWYQTVGPSVIRLFTGLLRGLAPNDQVLVLGVMEWDSELSGPDRDVVRDFFDTSSKTQFKLPVIEANQRSEYFEKLIDLIRKSPIEYPDLGDRKKRVLPVLPKVVAKATDGPTPEELKAKLKAQKKEDRHALNLLKMCIQPIMDHIKKTYKRFRTPPIDDSLIAYLFTEADPANLVSDLPEEYRAKEQYRPYEIAKDDKGEPGLLEVTTRKFYYNMEIVTIEQRLSNGYYKRTKDFFADIKKITKDAKTIGDTERSLKANELMNNVEVDLNMLEKKDPQLMEACEQVYHREVARAQQRLEQIRNAPTNKNVALQVDSAIPRNSYSTEQSTGPVMLGERVPGRPALPVLKETPSDRGLELSSLSNGYSTHAGHVPNSRSNGSFEVAEDDVHMENSLDTSGHHNNNHLETPTNRMDQPSISKPDSLQRQISSLTPMAHNSQAADYHNSASTTTSGQKTSDQSSGHKGNTQSTNGTGKSEHPDFSMVGGLGGASQLPDTQEQNFPSSGSQAQPSQTSPAPSQRVMAPPAPRNATIAAILNLEPSSPPAPPTYQLDELRLEDLKLSLTEVTHGFTVEQLEQVNASLMYTVWMNRSDYNRTRVANAVREAFETTVGEMSSTLARNPEFHEGSIPPSQYQY